MYNQLKQSELKLANKQNIFQSNNLSASLKLENQMQLKPFQELINSFEQNSNLEEIHKVKFSESSHILNCI